MESVNGEPHTHVLKALDAKIEPAFGIAFLFCSGAVAGRPDVEVRRAAVGALRRKERIRLLESFPLNTT